MIKRGRPKVSKLTRAEQLRSAKRTQRQRERAAGLVQLQLRLPRRTAAKLRTVLRGPNYVDELERLLDEAIIHVADYPMLADLAWNRADSYIPAREAFALYERNWRFVDLRKLAGDERTLIKRLAARYGNGIIHA